MKELLLAFVLGIIAASAVLIPLRHPDCPEDAALFWSGDKHSLCLTLDDFPGWSDASWRWIDQWDPRLAEQR